MRSGDTMPSASTRSRSSAYFAIGKRWPVGKRKGVLRARPGVSGIERVGSSAAALAELHLERHALSVAQHDDRDLVARFVRVERIRILV